jgi:hypothetical protein
MINFLYSAGDQIKDLTPDRQAVRQSAVSPVMLCIFYHNKGILKRTDEIAIEDGNRDLSFQTQPK